MALLIASTPAAAVRSPPSRRNSVLSVFSISRRFSYIENIDGASLSDSPSPKDELAEFGWTSVTTVACQSRGKTLQSKLLLDNATISSSLSTLCTPVTKSSKLLSRSVSIKSIHSIRSIRSIKSIRSYLRRSRDEPGHSRSTSGSSSSTLIPTSLSYPLPSEERGLFGPATPVRLVSPQLKRRRITPPVSKYKNPYGRNFRPKKVSASSSITLKLILPRNLVHIPPFFPPRARLEVEFKLFGFLTFLYDYARLSVPRPRKLETLRSVSLSALRLLRPLRSLRSLRSRRPPLSFPSLPSFRSFRSLRSASSSRTLRSLRARSIRSVRHSLAIRPHRLILRRLSRRKWERKHHGAQLSHLVRQITDKRLRTFERIQALKRVIVDNGGAYDEKKMKKAQEEGSKLAKVTLPRILFGADETEDDWVLL